MSNDSGNNLPYAPEGLSTLETLSFANIYPSGVAPCYSQGLICIDAACGCHAFKLERDKLRRKCLRELLNSEASRPHLSNSQQHGFRRYPEDTVINRTSAPGMAEADRRNGLGRTTAHASNQTDLGANGVSHRINLLANNRAQARAMFHVRRSELAETSRSDGPVAKP